MGLLTPTIVNFKILLQKLWENEAKWDEKVDPKIAKDWEVLLSGLSDLAELKIPRLVPCFSTDGINYQGELHIFCDASELAYGAVAYIRSKINRKMYVTLLCSKSRVTPLPKKGFSIARLELMAALIGSRLANYICQAMNPADLEVTMWSDSMITLHWIKQKDPEVRKEFVRNRVLKSVKERIQKIGDIALVLKTQRITSPEDWPQKNLATNKNGGAGLNGCHRARAIGLKIPSNWTARP